MRKVKVKMVCDSEATSYMEFVGCLNENNFFYFNESVTGFSVNSENIRSNFNASDDESTTYIEWVSHEPGYTTDMDLCNKPIVVDAKVKRTDLEDNEFVDYIYTVVSVNTI